MKWGHMPKSKEEKIWGEESMVHKKSWILVKSTILMYCHKGYLLCGLEWISGIRENTQGKIIGIRNINYRNRGNKWD